MLPCFQYSKQGSRILEKEVNIPALSRTIRIIDVLVAHGNLSANQIIRILGLPKSSVYNLLNQLKRERIVDQDRTGQYVLGLKLLEWGGAVSAHQDLRDVAYQHLEALASKTEMLCHLGILDNDTPIYLVRVDSLSHIQVKTWEGKQLCIYRSSLGKCLLAYLDKAKQQQIIKSISFVDHLPNSIGSRAELEQELTRIRSLGWAKDDEEDAANIRCVSAPIFDKHGAVIAAISLVGTVMHIGDNFTFEDAASEVRNTATAISRELGFNGEVN